MSDSKKKINVDDLLKRHLGKPSEPRPRQGSEVSRVAESETFSLPPTSSGSASQPIAPARATAEADAQQAGKIISSIASDIENMRAAMELMVEQIGKMVSLQSEQMSMQGEQTDLQKQHIEAVARLAPLVVQTQEVITGSVRDAVSSIQDLQEGMQTGYTLDGRGSEHIEAVSAERAIVAGDSVVRRPRGRPRKIRPEAAPGAGSENGRAAIPSTAPVPPRRPRGRPRKIQEPEVALPLPVMAVGAASSSDDSSVGRRPRGRPRKIREPELSPPAAASSNPSELRRPRGRPRKVPLAAGAHAPQDSQIRIPEMVQAARPALPGAEPEMPRRRGRPRKHPLQPAGIVSPPNTPSPAGNPDGGTATWSIQRSTVRPGMPAAERDWDESAWLPQALVYSLPDKKDPRKYVTVIQVERKLWESAGFNPKDRLEIERDGYELFIYRADTGGVKAKKIDDDAVMIQASNLGNLNLKQVKVAAGRGAVIVRGLKV
ncbi:MAG: hypothetical protein K0S56_2667 [Microvirga sp.]|jgi:hypothetical protein|nr:hypothetical protein [Microvirga sp.]